MHGKAVGQVHAPSFPAAYSIRSAAWLEERRGKAQWAS